MSENTTPLTREHVVEVMRSERFVMLTSLSTTGKLHSHPMTPLEVTDEADVYFFVNVSTDHAGNLRHDSRVNVAFTDNTTWLSVAGEVTFLEGAEKTAKIDELWNDATAAWYEGGKNDANLGVVRVTSEAAQLWNQEGGMVSQFLDFAKARITGEKPDDGGTGTVTL